MFSHDLLTIYTCTKKSCLVFVWNFCCCFRISAKNGAIKRIFCVRKFMINRSLVF